MKNQYLTAKEAANILNLSRSSLYKLARTNKLPTTKVGGSLLFEKEAIDSYSSRTIIQKHELSEPKLNTKVIEYWMIPRSKRKLVTLQEMIRNDYVNGIIGSKWKGTRSSHRQRDKNLQLAQIRGGSVDRFVDDNPGGARTDVALLAALGFYAFDEKGYIHLTFQGKEMLDSKKPAHIITQQLLQVRYPSPYSTSINMDPAYKIFPYRFLLRLLTSKELIDDISTIAQDGIITLTQKEIARYVITEARQDNDLNKVIDSIINSRKCYEIIEVSEKLNNIANTFINNLEITGWIKRGSKGSLYIAEESFKDVVELLKIKPRSFNYAIGKEFEFQDRLGMDPTKSKYTRSLTSNRTGGEKAVKFLLLDFLRNHPMSVESVTEELIKTFARNAGTTESIATDVFNTILRESPNDYFSEHYLKLSRSGRSHARDFEFATAEIIFQIAKNAKWVGKQGKSPDIIFELKPFEASQSVKCIIDCKAEGNYSISNDHFNRMTVEEDGYIPSYNADIFIYVANNFSNSFYKNLKRIEDKCNIPGSGISAENLLYLLDRYRKSPIEPIDLIKLFSHGKIITIADINTIFNANKEASI